MFTLHPALNVAINPALNPAFTLALSVEFSLLEGIVVLGWMRVLIVHPQTLRAAAAIAQCRTGRIEREPHAICSGSCFIITSIIAVAPPSIIAASSHIIATAHTRTTCAAAVLR